MTDKSKVKVDVDLPDGVEKLDPTRPHTEGDPHGDPPPPPPAPPHPPTPPETP